MEDDTMIEQLRKAWVKQNHGISQASEAIKECRSSTLDVERASGEMALSIKALHNGFKRSFIDPTAIRPK